MSKQFWGVIVLIVLVFVGIFAFTGKDSKSSNSSKAKAGTVTNHVTGSTASGVTLTEYGDFQCPYCQQYSTTVSQIQDQYKDRVQFRFRHFPLINVHPNAFSAARAAEAASFQGKFWEMHDALYAQGNWSVWTAASDPVTYFNQYAKQIGLNVDTFKKDYASSQVNDLVNADMAQGNKLKIQGTPSFFINDKQVQITNTASSFQQVLDAAIAKQAASAAKQ